MHSLRTIVAGVTIAALAACASPSRQETVLDAEVARLAPIKAAYPGVVMGFDVKNGTTLLVSIDVNGYIGTDDDKIVALKESLVKRWPPAWAASHPGKHATLHVRIIDFVGKTIWSETTTA